VFGFCDLLGRLQELLAAEPPVVGVVGEQHPLRAVLRAALQQEDAAVLDHFLGFDGDAGTSNTARWSLP
jgi:hypothetical protein